jgi:hypothetical protein
MIEHIVSMQIAAEAPVEEKVRPSRMPQTHNRTYNLNGAAKWSGREEGADRYKLSEPISVVSASSPQK